MKPMRIVFLVFCMAQFGVGADVPLQRIKKSTEKCFDAKAEVAAFYLDLLAHNPAAKRQFDSLASKASSYGDVHFGTDDPQVVEWFPKSGRFSVGENFSDDAHYLVVQPLTFSRPRQQDYELMVLSEFRVVHKGETHFAEDGKAKGEKLDSNEITITFLGFRNFKLTPLK